MQDILKEFKGKRVLVTGGLGMVGRQVVSRLLEVEAVVHTVDLKEQLIPGVSLHCQESLVLYDFCLELVKGNYDYVFHLAGLKGSARDTTERQGDYFTPMLQMTVNMLAACAEARVPHVVFTSSIGAYAESTRPFKEDVDRDFPPMDPICWAKRMGELQIALTYKEKGLNWGCVRLAATYGPHDNFHEGAMLIPSLMFKIKRRDSWVQLGSPYPVRDFLYAGDAAEGIIRAAVKGTKGDFVNLGTGKAYTIAEAVDTMGRIFPFRYEFAGGTEGIYQRRVMDITRAKDWLDWEPKVSLEEGLRKTWEWLSTERRYSDN